MSIITITGFTEENGVPFYDINVRLPLRSIQCSKRYSDFVTLLNALSAELGISNSDFPYLLPQKSGVFANKRKVATGRQPKLAHFLNQLVKDRDIQNSILVHEFLLLPPKFKFTPELFKDDIAKSDDKFLIPEALEKINRMQWLSYLRNVRTVVESLNKSNILAAKLANREKASKFIRPNIEKLTEALQHLSQTGEISSQEFKQRTSMLSSLQSDMENIITETPLHSSPDKNVKISKRVFYQTSNTPVETSETVNLSNKGLLQRQQQIHNEQDKELEALRKIIARQRQIGETINKEVEEQLEILDSFSNEVDVSGAKLSSARQRVKKIT